MNFRLHCGYVLASSGITEIAAFASSLSEDKKLNCGLSLRGNDTHRRVFTTASFCTKEETGVISFLARFLVKHMYIPSCECGRSKAKEKTKLSGLKIKKKEK